MRFFLVEEIARGGLVFLLSQNSEGIFQTHHFTSCALLDLTECEKEWQVFENTVRSGNDHPPPPSPCEAKLELALWECVCLLCSTAVVHRHVLNLHRCFVKQHEIFIKRLAQQPASFSRLIHKANRRCMCTHVKCTSHSSLRILL